MPQCVSENLCGPAQGAGRDLLVSVCVCVCERERDRERESERVGELGKVEGEGRENTSYGVETASAIRTKKCLFIVPCLRYF